MRINPFGDGRLNHLDSMVPPFSSESPGRYRGIFISTSLQNDGWPRLSRELYVHLITRLDLFEDFNDIYLASYH